MVASFSRADEAANSKGNRTCDFYDHKIKMAAPMDERISVPIDDPNADTEWYFISHSRVPLNSKLSQE